MSQLWSPPRSPHTLPQLWTPPVPQLWSRAESPNSQRHQQQQKRGRSDSVSTSTSSEASETSSAPGSRIRNPGRRFAQIVRLKPEHVETYRKVHAAVWPEVQKQIKDCNIREYSIYHDPGTSLLFANFRYVGYDYEGDMERMRENPKVREWWSMTDDFQESLVDGAKDSESGNWWKPVEEVFYQA